MRILLTARRAASKKATSVAGWPSVQVGGVPLSALADLTGLHRRLVEAAGERLDHEGAASGNGGWVAKTDGVVNVPHDGDGVVDDQVERGRRDLDGRQAPSL